MNHLMRLACVVMSMALVATARVGANDDVTELVPEDTCIVELTLPEGATVTVDGEDCGTRRRFVYEPLTPGEFYQHEFVVRYPSGKESKHNLLLEGGRRVRLAKRDPAGRIPELVVQAGHGSAICSVAFSPDGRNILTGSLDNTTILWDAKTGRELRTFEGGSDWIKFVAFSPDGRTILTGPRIGGAILWDPKTGRKLRTFGGYSKHIWTVAFSPDGRNILTGSVDKTAVLWDVKTGRKLRTFEGHSSLVSSVAFSPDGRSVLTGSADKTAILWDVRTGRGLRTFEGHAELITGAAFSPDGRAILTGSTDKTAILWDLKTGRKLRTFEANSSIPFVAFRPDGRTILTGILGRAGILWDVKTGRELRTFETDSRILSVAFSPDGRTILTGLRHTTPILWDVKTGRKLRVLGGHSGHVRCLAFSPDGQTFLTGSEDNAVILWDTKTHRKLRTFEGHLTQLNALAFSPDGQTIVTGSSDETAILWDVKTGRKLRTFEADSCVVSLAFGPDGRTILIGVWKETAILWDVKTGRELRTFEGHPDSFTSLAFGPEGRTILTNYSNNTAVLWDAKTGGKLQTFEGHSGGITRLAFSPDGQTVLTGSADNTAILWDAKTGRKIRTFVGHSSSVASVTFSPDGRTVLTGSADKTAILWDLKTGRKLQTFEGYSCSHSPLAFSPDGRTIMGASGAIRAWSVATGEALYAWRYVGDGEHSLVTTPEGLFDGSPEAVEHVCYRIGDGLNVVPGERFFQDFYRPGLLQAVIRGERPLPDVEIGRELPPNVRIVSPERFRDTEEETITVEAVVENKGGGIKTPWIRQNGIRVVVKETPVEEEGDKLRWRFTLPLVDGENRIEVHSASADGSWESEPDSVTVRRTRSTEVTEVYLLAVGVSRYADEAHNLEYAAADAEAFAAVFRERGEKCYGEGRVHIRTLTNADATSENIENAIAAIAEKAKPQDVFLLTLSGHGAMIDQRYFFLPHEFTGKDEGGWKDDVRRHGLPGDVLEQWINKVPALKRVVVYDTCQSGGAVAIAGLSRNPLEFQRAFETFRRSTGSHVIAAATASQDAEEIRDLGHGALTYALLAGLGAVDKGPLKTQAASTKNGLVQVRDWLSFAQDMVPALTKLYYGREQLVDVFAEGRSFPILWIEEGKQSSD